MTHLIRRAARAIAEADALFIGAGAGMGVDSGLPDFRGTHGFWRAYPACARQGLDFPSMANPHWFERDPSFAWGFYGHRLNLYRATQPHQGFHLLHEWAAKKSGGHFVFTSNVDGQFQRAGFPEHRIVEIHGSIHHMQCLRGCGTGLVPADSVKVEVNDETLRARYPLPVCPGCGGLLRPNVLMFGDPDWNYDRTAAQQDHLWDWLEHIGSARVAVIECGAGQTIPTVRHQCEKIPNATLIRINVREAEVRPGQIGLPMGALEALTKINEVLP